MCGLVTVASCEVRVASSAPGCRGERPEALLATRTSQLAALLCELPHPKVLLAPPADQLVGLELADLVDVAGERRLEGLRGGLVVGVRAARRLGDDLVDYLQLEQVR